MGRSFFIIILTGFIAQFSFSADLKLYDEVGSNDIFIQLGKIGELSFKNGENSEFVLNSLSLMSLPKEPIFLSAQEIFQKVKKSTGIQLNIIGNGITIYPLYTIILDQEVAEKIKTEVYKTYPDIAQYPIEIMYVKSPKFPKIPAGDIEYKILVPRGKIDITKYIRLQIRQYGKDIINMSIPIKIMFRTTKWIAKKKLNKGSVINKNNFFIKIEYLFQKPKDSFLTEDQFIGKTLRNKIKQGQKLKTQYLL